MESKQQTQKVTGVDDEGEPVTVYVVIEIKHPNEEEDEEDEEEEGNSSSIWLFLTIVLLIGVLFYMHQTGRWSLDQVKDWLQTLSGSAQAQSTGINSADTFVLEMSTPVAQPVSSNITQNTEEVEYTNVVYKPTGQRLPALSFPFECDSINLRRSIGSRNKKWNPWGVHGNKDYDGTVSWNGQDMTSNCGNNNTVAVLDGILNSKDFGGNYNGGANCWIQGVDRFVDFSIGYLHMNPQDCDGLEVNKQVMKGEYIGRYYDNSEGYRNSEHLHLECQYKGKDIPCTVLMPGIRIIEYTTGEYVDGAMPSETQIRESFDIP